MGDNGVTKGNILCGIAFSIVFLFVGANSVFAAAYEDQIMVEGFGLGYALTAMPQSLDAGYKNPALLSTIPHTLAGVTYSDSHDSQYSLFAFSAAKSTSIGTFGLYIPFRTISSIPITVEDGNQGAQIGSFSDSESEVKISFSHYLQPNFSLGIASAYKSHYLYNESASGYGLDVGGSYSGTFWRFGASVTDLVNDLIWTTGRNEKVKSKKHAGLSIDLPQHTKLAIDGDYGDSRVRGNLGLSWKPSPSLDVLLGIKDFTNDKNIRLGINLRLMGAMFSYAMSATGPLGVTHKVGVVVEL